MTDANESKTSVEADETTLQVFERLRLQNELLKDELLDLQRRHVELQRSHIELLEKPERTRQPLGDDERTRIIELARSGVGGTQIAAELGRPAGTISGEIYRARQRGELPPKSSD